MNLYRNFGTLMEAWITERGQCSCSNTDNNNDSPTPSSHMGTNLVSESVDSGVETASFDMSFPATSCSDSTDNIEIYPSSPEREGDKLIQASTSQSPAPSSPSPSSTSSSSLHVCSYKPQKRSIAVHHKVEQALQRTHSEHLKRTALPSTVEKAFRHHSRALSGRHTVNEGFKRRYRTPLECFSMDTMLQQHSQASSECCAVDEHIRGQSRPPSERLTADMLLNKQSQTSLEHLQEVEMLVQHSQASSGRYTVDDGLKQQSKASSEDVTVEKMLSRQSPAPSETLTVEEKLSRQSPAPSDTLTVEETLSRQSPAPSEPLIVDEVFTQHPQASFLPKRHTLELVRGQQPGLRRMDNPLVPMRQMHRQPIFTDKQPAHTILEDRAEEDGNGLSPGLSYLEHVCQMLEEIAKQQIHIRGLQMEMDGLQEHQDMDVSQALYICQNDSQGSEDMSSIQSLENKECAERSSIKTLHQREYQRHFRQRSASNPAITTLYFRGFNADHRGQHRSTDDLVAKQEEDDKKKESKMKEKNTINRRWTFRFKHLREESILRDRNRQQMQSSEKNSARQRLSQLFKRSRRKTLPE